MRVALIVSSQFIIALMGVKFRVDDNPLWGSPRSPPRKALARVWIGLADRPCATQVLLQPRAITTNDIGRASTPQDLACGSGHPCRRSEDASSRKLTAIKVLRYCNALFCKETARC